MKEMLFYKSQKFSLFSEKFEDNFFFAEFFFQLYLKPIFTDLTNPMEPSYICGQ